MQMNETKTQKLCACAGMEGGMSESNYTPHVGQPYAVTPETDAVWDDKSRNILTNARNMERQRDEAVTELAELTASHAEAIAAKEAQHAKQIEDDWNAGNIISAKYIAAIDAIEAQHAADLAAERTARKALTKALMICIRYSDHSAVTEQAHAALTLAAKLL
jgi:hypothetical protein